jgi:hypothetical protein
MSVESREVKNVIVESKLVFFGGIYVYVIQEPFGITQKFYDKNST